MQLKLKNGSKEDYDLVQAIMYSLTDIMDTFPVAIHDLVSRCRYPRYGHYGDNLKVLEDALLVQPDGGIHDSVRNVVLSAVTGRGTDLVIGSPYATEGAKEAAA